MSYLNKQDKKVQMYKMIEQAMKTPQYQEARKKDVEQAALQAYMSFCMIACDYLNQMHNYKKNGLKKFLVYAAKRLKYVEENESYFIEMNDMFKEECGIDVLETLGLRIGESGEIK